MRNRQRERTEAASSRAISGRPDEFDPVPSGFQGFVRDSARMQALFPCDRARPLFNHPRDEIK